MCTAEDQNVGIRESVRESFRQINARHFLGNRMVNPTFFDQWHKQRTRFLTSADGELLQRFLVSMTLDGGFGTHHHYFFIPSRLCRRLSSWPDDSLDWHMCSFTNFIDRQCRCRIAGDDEHLCPLFFQIVRSAYS